MTLGYLFIADNQIPSIQNPSKELIKEKDGLPIPGKYLHRMVVFSFGDCNGRRYTSRGARSVIDHLDMNHENNSVSNLQLVSQGINLFRAYYKTGYKECEELFKSYYNSLDEIDKKILDMEINLDLEGKY